MNRWKECLKHGMTLETKHNLGRGTLTPDEYNEKLATKYARWIAERDSIAIPASLKIRVEWSGFMSSYRTRKTKTWSDSTSDIPVYCRRIAAVEWGRDEERYNTRKDRKRGAWTHNEFVAECRIEIPFWDFEPTPPVEVIETELALAA